MPSVNSGPSNSVTSISSEVTAHQRTTAQLAGMPSAGDLQMRPGTLFYDPTQIVTAQTPLTYYVVTPGGYVSLSGTSPIETIVTNASIQLGRIYRALAQAQFQPVVVEWFGDSTVYGNWSDNANSVPSQVSPTYIADERSAAGQFRTMCAQFYGAKAGFHRPAEGVVSGGNPLSLGFGIGASGTAYNAAGTVTWVLPGCTNVTLYYWNNDGSGGGATVNGSGSFTVNGGTAINTPNVAGNGKYSSVSTTTGLNAASTNTIVWTAPAGAYQGLVGVSYDSGKGINVGRFGNGGWALADFMGHGNINKGLTAAADGWLLNSFTFRNPSLVIGQLNINDAGFPAGTTLASQLTYWTNIVNQVTSNGSCMLLIADNQPSTYTNGNQAQFEAIMAQVASANPNVAYIRFADIMGTYSSATNNGLMGDVTHPNGFGYGLLARAIYRLLIGNPTGPQF